MIISIIGTGAVGGYYGAKLANVGFNVHFLLRSDYLVVKNSGITVDSPKGNLICSHVNAYVDINDMPKTDLVIIAVKTTENVNLFPKLTSICHKNTIVLLLQNGLTVENDLKISLPNNLIIGGLCFLCAEKIAPGKIAHFDYGAIKFAPLLHGCNLKEISEQLALIGSLFDKAGIQTQIVNNLAKARWEKLVWNIPFNGLSVILRSTTQQLLSHTESNLLIRAIMTEVVNAAQSLHIPLNQSLIDTQIHATQQMIDYSPSMKVDFERKKVMELEQIYLKPLAAANDNGFNMPLVTMLAQQLAFIEHHNLTR